MTETKMCKVTTVHFYEHSTHGSLSPRKDNLGGAEAQHNCILLGTEYFYNKLFY